MKIVLIISAIFLLSQETAFSQISVGNAIIFTYDANGNRVKRNLTNGSVVLKKAAPKDTASLTVQPSSLSFFPNPAYQKLKIEMVNIASSNTALAINIYNIQGVLVYHKDDFVGNHEIDMSNLSAGAYFLNLKYANESVLKKIIKIQ